MTCSSAILNPPICVLGMHRSGTSCLAGSLELAGVHLGEVTNKSPHNKKGNKENKELRQINEDVLAFSGGSWDQPPETLKWNSELQARRDAHIAGFKDIPLWGFKDPRCLITLPFWREALADMRFVATVRYPVAVVQSLTSRPGLAPRTPALQLWIKYNQPLLQLCQNETVHLLCFDWPETVYLNALERLNAALGLPGPSGQVNFFETGLRSAVPVRFSEMSEVEKQADMLYESLLSHALSDLKPQ